MAIDKTKIETELKAIEDAAAAIRADIAADTTTTPPTTGTGGGTTTPPTTGGGTTTPPPAKRVVELPNLPDFTLAADAPDASFIYITGSNKTYSGYKVGKHSLAFKVNVPSSGPLNISGTKINKIKSDGAAGILRVYGGTFSDFEVADVHMENVGYAPGVSASVFISGNTTIKNGAFRRIYAHFTAPITSPGDVYAGITFYGKDANDIGDGIVMEDIKFVFDKPGVQYADPSKYPNRDGMAIEAGYKNITMNRIHIIGAADGGLDLKSPSVTVNNYTAENNDKSMRRWHPGHDGAIHSKNPGKYHFMHMGDGTREIDFVKFEGDPSKPVVHFESGGSVGNGPRILIIHDWDISENFDAAKQVWISKGISDPCELHLPDGRIIKK